MNLLEQLKLIGKGGYLLAEVVPSAAVLPEADEIIVWRWAFVGIEDAQVVRTIQAANLLIRVKR